MCLLLMIGMLIFGIVILVRGKYRYTGRMGGVREVRGKSARVVGILLIAPLLLFYLLGGAILQLEKISPDQKEIWETAFGILAIAIPLLCLISAINIVRRTSQPEPKELIFPDGFDERFQTGTRDDTESQDITGGPSRPPTSPDDRIQT